LGERKFRAYDYLEPLLLVRTVGWGGDEIGLRKEKKR